MLMQPPGPGTLSWWKTPPKNVQFCYCYLFENQTGYETGDKNTITVFILIVAHAPISTHPLYFEVNKP